MKWIRRLLLLTLCLVVLAIAGSAFGYRLLHGKPRWYVRPPQDAHAREQAASRVEDKIVEARNWLQGSAPQTRPAAATAEVGPSIAPPLILSLTEEEMNAFFSKWDEAYNWNQRYSRYFTEPQIVLHEGHLILAATSTDLDTVVSIDMQPSIDSAGQVHLDVTRIMGGELPLPKALWQRYSGTLAQGIAERLPAMVDRARLRPDGSANDQMMEAVLGKMLLQFLNSAPASPVVFLPSPAKLRSVRIDDKTLHLTFERLDAHEAQAALDALREQ